MQHFSCRWQRLVTVICGVGHASSAAAVMHCNEPDWYTLERVLENKQGSCVLDVDGGYV